VSSPTDRDTPGTKHLRLVLAVLFLGIVVAMTCAPVADYFPRWKVPRAASVLGTYPVLATLLACSRGTRCPR
jgi:predicted PurR-regulated permease PerM